MSKTQDHSKNYSIGKHATKSVWHKNETNTAFNFLKQSSKPTPRHVFRLDKLKQKFKCTFLMAGMEKSSID